jgi:hypothetical protein
MTMATIATFKASNLYDEEPKQTPLDFRFARFTEFKPEDHASDHCPVVFHVP